MAQTRVEKNFCFWDDDDYDDDYDDDDYDDDHFDDDDYDDEDYDLTDKSPNAGGADPSWEEKPQNREWELQRRAPHQDRRGGEEDDDC